MRKMLLAGLTTALLMLVGVQTAGASALALPNDCLAVTTGKLICASKASGRVFAVKDGVIVDVIVAGFSINPGKSRYGGKASDGTSGWFTREGRFKVNFKDLSRISTLYHVEMRYVLNFSGGEHIHYSSEYAQTGYPYSHGCIGLKSLTFAKWLYNWAPVGTPVIVTKH